jgi:hypothetical protein
MSVRTVVALGLVPLVLTSCGTHAADPPASSFPAHYGETKACLDALNAAQAYIQGVGVTATKDYLTGLIEDAFRAGATHDLAAGRQALDQLDHATKPDAETVRLIHEFTAAAAECRNPKEAQ